MCAERPVCPDVAGVSGVGAVEGRKGGVRNDRKNSTRHSQLLGRRKGACKGCSRLCVSEYGVHAAHLSAVFLVKDLLNGTTSGKAVFYLLGCIVCFGLILLTTWFQYNGTYFTTYKESGTRRLTLAERLRKLPLSFFGKRDLADLTSTIMADCEVLEKD